MKNIKKYIFVTNEGFTYQPDSEASEPDIENMQVLGFGNGSSAKVAFDDMIANNPHLYKTNFNETIGLELKNDKRYSFLINKT